MTGTEIRNKVCDTITNWVGSTRGSAEHREILSIYNAQEHLPRGYKMQTSDAYCAATVSAAWIKSRIGSYVPLECSCNEMMRRAKEMGIWIEDDSHTPKIGDAVMYDWQDSGKGDNTGAADHVGIVIDISGDKLTVAEGNMPGGVIGVRDIRVNDRYIRGYICPDYDAIAADIDAKTPGVTRYQSVDDMPECYRKEAQRLINRGALKGRENGLDVSEDMIRTLIICQRMVDGKEI